MKKLLNLLIFAGFLAFAPNVFAQSLYDWPSKAAGAMISDSSGLLFIGADKTVYRTYTWKQAKDSKSSALYTADLDRNGQPDVVGAGKPTFVLNHDAAPTWAHKKGCEKVVVADVAADKSRDLVCINGSTVTVYTYDGQMVWAVNLGRRIEYCVAGDINGDLKADIECKHKGKKTFSRIDGVSGDTLADAADTAELTTTELDQLEPVSEKSLSGESTYDFNGDGTAEETLTRVEDKAVVIQSRSKKVAIARIETKTKPLAAIVKDLDGDKKLDIVIITKSAVFVASADGKDVKEFSLNAKKYKRKAVAELQSVYGNGFADDTLAPKAVEAVNGKLANCYSNQVKKSQFAGEGQVLIEVVVNAKGKAKSAIVNHSALPDKKVVKCAQNVLKKAKYPKPVGEEGNVNVRMFYTFRVK